MISLKNKKGQEGVSSSGVLIGIVLLVVVAIAIIVFVLWYTGVIGDFGGQVPSDYAIVVGGCEQKASQISGGSLDSALGASVCTDWQYVTLPSGKEAWITCMYSLIKDSIPSLEDLKCEKAAGVGKNIGQLNKEKCDSLASESKKNSVIIVNDCICSITNRKGTLDCGEESDGINTCSDLDGIWKVSCTDSEVDFADLVSDVSDKTSNSGKKCCVTTVLANFLT